MFVSAISSAMSSGSLADGAAPAPANTGPLGKFWATLADGSTVLPAEVAAVRQTLSIGAFVKNTLPLISAVQERFSAGTCRAMPDLAKLSEQDWHDLITAAGASAVPGNITGPDPAGTFAREIYDRLTAAHSTAALSARAARFVPPAEQAPLTTFFANNATLDLRPQNLNAYLTSAGAAAFSGIAPADQAAVKANLGAIQRVLRIVRTWIPARPCSPPGLPRPLPSRWPASSNSWRSSPPPVWRRSI